MHETEHSGKAGVKIKPDKIGKEETFLHAWVQKTSVSSDMQITVQLIRTLT